LRERVLTIVGIIAQYVMDEREDFNETDIVEELLAEGFAAEEIDAAFSWMESLSLQPSKKTELELAAPTWRIFTPEENRALSAEARGFLVRLRSLGILDNESQEEIIERALQTDEGELSLRDIKTLTALTLFARSQDTWRQEVDCILGDDLGRLFH
jgi:Smg protein